MTWAASVACPPERHGGEAATGLLLKSTAPTLLLLACSGVHLLLLTTASGHTLRLLRASGSLGEAAQTDRPPRGAEHQCSPGMLLLGEATDPVVAGVIDVQLAVRLNRQPSGIPEIGVAHVVLLSGGVGYP